ncbi:hypothetical protein T06_14166 [Trichinella sp. T6]|nr:hypothetical protein T06_14166 [Trichinella sp. T6]
MTHSMGGNHAVAAAAAAAAFSSDANITELDGCEEDEEGQLWRGAPEKEGVNCTDDISPLPKSCCQKFTESLIRVTVCCTCFGRSIQLPVNEQYDEIDLPVAELSSGSEGVRRVNLCSKPTPVERTHG